MIDNDTPFGLRVRYLRTMRNMKQVELVEKLEAAGVTLKGSSYISELERTEKRPAADLIEALADVLGTSTDFLMGRINDPRPLESENMIVVHAESESERRMLLEWIEFLRKLPPDLARLLLAGLASYTEEVRTWSAR